mmetsp:Transcript_584/g.4099  ORF Transcript_584/g.4099 Transcript_584/m.4099 type:complete len:87 (+) Transcript_584:2992-3252(+)
MELLQPPFHHLPSNNHHQPRWTTPSRAEECVDITPSIAHTSKWKKRRGSCKRGGNNTMKSAVDPWSNPIVLATFRGQKTETAPIRA